MDETDYGYPLAAMAKGADGERRLLMPATLKFKMDLKAGEVLHLDGYDIETQQAVKAGESAQALVINGSVIISLTTTRETAPEDFRKLKIELV